MFAPATKLVIRQNAPDIGLAVLVLLIIGMMIVPLPTPILDILIAANIAIAVLLMLVAMYVSSGLDLASFPTLLLITTLFRLSLNISSSRLILLQADAGHVITAFGQFVVRGNYVVGGVVFFLLTLVQFLVIAKGAERVAEVGARFTLDAMPGKQMSIDAELRSGALDQETARIKRSQLSRESQFYGAMDGAMKFVKGDAIAGIVITLVNILGGLAVGIGMNGMDAVTSLQTYGLLTIGDGLVSQIPALLLSTSAGLVVTRVASEEAGSSLGRDVVGQIFGRPRPLLVAATFLLVLAIIPGLPAMPFLVLAGLFFAIGRKLLKETAITNQTTGDTSQGSTISGAGSTKTTIKSHVPLVAPITLDIGSDVHHLFNEDGNILTAEIAALRDHIFAELGVSLPTIRARLVQSLANDEILIGVQEVPIQRVTVDLKADRSHVAEQIIEILSEVVRKRASDFVGLQETQSMLDQLERAYPALIRNVVPKPIPLSLLADILRRLVDESVSIRPMREILETLAVYGVAEKDPVELTELIRSGLKRQITHRYAPSGTLGVYLVDPSFEDAIRDSIRRTATGSYLAMPPDIAREAASNAQRLSTENPGVFIVLTQPDIRRFLFRLLEHEVPHAIVLSYAELAPGVVIHPLGRLSP